MRGRSSFTWNTLAPKPMRLPSNSMHRYLSSTKKVSVSNDANSAAVGLFATDIAHSSLAPLRVRPSRRSGRLSRNSQSAR